MPDDVDAIAKEVFDYFVETDPTFATYMGIHEYDHLLPEGSPRAIREEVAFLKKTRKRLAAVPEEGLPLTTRIDRSALLHVVDLALFEYETLRTWERFPNASSTVGGSVYTLFLRDFAPLDVRLRSISGRLLRTAKYYDEHRARTKDPVKIWCEIGLESTERLPGLLTVVEAAGKEALPVADFAELSEAAARAREAMGSYARWIRSDILPKAKDEVGIGAGPFRELVEIRHLGLTVEEIYSLGQRFLRDSKRELKKIAAEIKPGATVDDVKALVKSNRPPDFAGALEYTAKAMSEARQFVLDKNLATVPPGEELKVIETPAFLRHVIPFAAYSSPGRFEVKQQGLYMVTPVEDKPEMMAEFNYPGIRNTAVHEGYPGHHLQLVCANRAPSWARALVHATETVEGWAHYCEEMVKDHGFYPDPETRFVQILDQIWRACRIIIDVDLHTRRMSFDEAVDFLVREAGMERPGALAEVRRYTYNPAYQLSYLIGKHLIKKLRADVKRSLGKSYTDRFFHDTLLYAGSLPAHHMRELFEAKVAEMKRIDRETKRKKKKR